MKTRIQRKGARARRICSPVVMWAVVVIGKRSSWINYTAMGRTRRDAWKSYCAMWSEPETAENFKRRGEVRLAKVLVSELGAVI